MTPYSQCTLTFDFLTSVSVSAPRSCHGPYRCTDKHTNTQTVVYCALSVWPVDGGEINKPSSAIRPSVSFIDNSLRRPTCRCEIFLSPYAYFKVPAVSTLILEVTRISLQHSEGYRSKIEASMPKISAIHLAILVEHRLVTDRLTDTNDETHMHGHRSIAYTALAQRRAVKIFQ